MDKCVDLIVETADVWGLAENCEYWKAAPKNKDRQKMASNSLDGFYSLMQMRFGLRNAPSAFRWIEGAAFTTVQREFAFVYLDDIPTFFCSAAYHMDKAKHVSKHSGDAWVSLKSGKCSRSTAIVHYLGHVNRPRGLTFASDVTGDIKRLKVQQNVTELKLFSGLCNVFRQSLPSFERNGFSLNDKQKVA